MHKTALSIDESALPGRIMKVNHSGEFGAVNIYKAQLFVAQLFVAPLFAPKCREFLRECLSHEKQHLEIFRLELERRGVRRCRSYLWCGMGGYVLGFVTGVLGRNSILSCTSAVEEVVLRHLRDQLEILTRLGDKAAHDAVLAIVADEEAHHELGMQADKSCIFYKPYTSIISWCTESVIWLGMRL